MVFTSKKFPEISPFVHKAFFDREKNVAFRVSSVFFRASSLQNPSIKIFPEQASCTIAGTKLFSYFPTKIDINLPYITVVDNEPKHLEMKLTRAKFEEIIAPIVEKSVKPCKQALKDAKLKPEDIDHVVLVGGTTRIPYVKKKVEEIFGK